MYESFYGLRENPFNVTPDPQYIYLGENHREALAQLLYGVREKKGFIVITGEVGTGKTTLIHYLLSKMNGNSHTKTAFLFNPKLTVQDFIQYILQDLGAKVDGGTKGEHLHLLHRILLDAYREDERIVVIIDEAQGLNPELLEEIRLLSNLETAKSKLIQIVLVGQPELNETLSRPEFRQLKQRINMRFHLPALSEKETREYVEKRLKTAGAGKPVFTEAAAREIYARSRGVPRLINILCDNALLNGYAVDQKVVDERCVREAARDLKLFRKMPAWWVWALLGVAAVAAGVGLYLYFSRGSSVFPVYRQMMRWFMRFSDVMREGFREVSRLFGDYFAI